MTPTSGRVARRAVVGGVLALGGALAALGGAGPATAASVLIGPAPTPSASAPGLHVLAGDLTCPGDAPAITITADDVRLDLGGNTLTGDGGGSGIGTGGTDVNPTLEGLRVENGTVAGFEDGVLVDDAPGARVAGVTARDIGIVVVDSPGARVAGNTATGSGDIGIVVGDSPRSRIEGNDDDGFDLEDVNLGEDPPGCFNTWRGNRFATDNEGDGPAAGCIR